MEAYEANRCASGLRHELRPCDIWGDYSKFGLSAAVRDYLHKYQLARKPAYAAKRFSGTQRCCHQQFRSRPQLSARLRANLEPGYSAPVTCGLGDEPRLQRLQGHAA